MIPASPLSPSLHPLITLLAVAPQIVGFSKERSASRVSFKQRPFDVVMCSVSEYATNRQGRNVSAFPHVNEAI